MRKALLLAVAALLLLFPTNTLAQQSAAEAALQTERCVRYAAEHPELTLLEVRIAIKLKLDEESYTNVVTSARPGALGVLVGKHYALPLTYVPAQLVAVEEAYAMRGVRLRADCYEAFLAMVHDMELEGLSLYIKSGYRMNVENENPSDMWNAWPGHSEHQTGCAFDLRLKTKTHTLLREYKYETTAEYVWLCENAHKYGFILSYPEGKTEITGFEFEPWHWRYVGVRIATDMREKGFATFPEYWALYLMPLETRPCLDVQAASKDICLFPHVCLVYEA
jgi:LAS superfamily LD-carboxypeptidase LdcB